MSEHDVLFGYGGPVRVRRRSASGPPAGQWAATHHSTHHRWKRRVDRWGLKALRVRERRQPPALDS